MIIMSYVESRMKSSFPLFLNHKKKCKFKDKKKKKILITFATFLFFVAGGFNIIFFNFIYYYYFDLSYYDILLGI